MAILVDPGRMGSVVADIMHQISVAVNMLGKHGTSLRYRKRDVIVSEQGRM